MDLPLRLITARFLDVVRIIVIIRDWLARLILEQGIQVINRALKVPLNELLNGMKGILADLVVFDHEFRCRFQKQRDQFCDSINLVASDSAPPGRLRMKKLSEQRMVVVSWQLSSSCSMIHL